MTSVRSRARSLLYELLGVFLVAQAVFDRPQKSRSALDEAEISAARRLPHVATIEDALY
jgi:hypothetical protein